LQWLRGHTAVVLQISQRSELRDPANLQGPAKFSWVAAPSLDNLERPDKGFKFR
jgi:hypothetical protein